MATKCNATMLFSVTSLLGAQASCLLDLQLQPAQDDVVAADEDGTDILSSNIGRRHPSMHCPVWPSLNHQGR
jgi:hypothetical protein